MLTIIGPYKICLISLQILVAQVGNHYPIDSVFDFLQMFYLLSWLYFWHKFFKLNQTFILEGCSEDFWVCVYMKRWNTHEVTLSPEQLWDELNMFMSSYSAVKETESLMQNTKHTEIFFL